MLRNYSIILVLVLIIIFGGIYFYLNSKISDLNETIIIQEQIIKDKQTELNIKDQDIKAKEETISTLEEKIKKSSANTEELLQNIQVLIDIPDEEPVVVSCDNNNETKKEVIVDENAKKLSNVRNNIFSRYR